VIGDIRPKESCRFFNPNDRKEAWECLRGPDQIFRPLQLPIQILERTTEVILLLGNQSGVSEPVNCSDETAHYASSPSTVRRSPDSIASPSVSAYRSQRVTEWFATTCRVKKSSRLASTQKPSNAVSIACAGAWSRIGLENRFKTINARAATVDTAHAFRSAFKKRRYLVPADGFYEWKEVIGGKIPYSIEMKGSLPVVFAGLWEGLQNPEN
jgi:hypothetical protein